MQGPSDVEHYELPIISSRRGIITAVVLLTVTYAALFAVTGIERFSDGIVISLFAILLLSATTPLIDIHHPVSRLIIVAPLCVPFFIGAAKASTTQDILMWIAFGFEALIFPFLFLQGGTAQVTVRGVQRRRFVTTSVGFEEISGVKRFDSNLGKLLRLVGFGATNVELLLFSWKTFRLNLHPEEVDLFIEEVSREIDTTEQYDLFFAEPVVKTVVIVDGVEQEVKPKRRRGKKAKKLANQQKAATQTQAAVR